MKNLIIMTMSVFLLFIAAGLIMNKNYYASVEVPISAPIKVVHAKLNDLGSWLEWGEWNVKDPTLKVQTGEVSQGVGATNSWQGESGSGRLELTKSQDDHITYNVWFAKEALKNHGEFLLREHKGQTFVQWNMWGHVNHPILGGYMAKFMEVMNKKIAKESLYNLKNILEQKPKVLKK
ncbi:MAG: SRPBCC family protein [Bdellovibrionales bacterium]|nr:SRPBCC family protein [Bdellovibrionales bacterium]